MKEIGSPEQCASKDVHSWGIVPCPRLPQVFLTMMCVHEHQARAWLCREDVELIKKGIITCMTCHDAGAPGCPVVSIEYHHGLLTFGLSTN